MLYYAKITGLGLLVAGLLVFGWTVKGWADDAGQLKNARAALRDEQKRSISIQVERNEAQKAYAQASAELADLRLKTRQANINAGVKSLQKQIHENVKADPDCDVGEPVAGLLNRARAGHLPDTTTLTARP